MYPEIKDPNPGIAVPNGHNAIGGLGGQTDYNAVPVNPVPVSFAPRVTSVPMENREFKPEPVEELEPETLPVMDEVLAADLDKVLHDPDVAAALAAEGLSIDYERVEADLRPLHQVLSTESGLLKYELEDGRSGEATLPLCADPEAPVTLRELHDAKVDINNSFEEVANIVIEQQRQIDEILARMQAFNMRGGHKI